jgi:hypothetical protein
MQFIAKCSNLQVADEELNYFNLFILKRDSKGA